MKRLVSVLAVLFAFGLVCECRAQGYGGYHYQYRAPYSNYSSVSYTPYGGFPVYSNFSTMQFGNQTYFNYYQPAYSLQPFYPAYSYPLYAPARYAPAYYTTINGR